ncbi:histidine kinase [Leifsonia shinshuensis]|uniref:histidine kinase n=1 Tax=Leifsonia shinshuensis TaxID=150026 RepID=A0A853CV16_9MICO|nr:signal transduction histidine kinase [Leifsonia shinshuensis]
MTDTTTAADAAPADLELPRPPGAVRRYFGAHPRVVDTIVVAVYLVPALAEGVFHLVTSTSWATALQVVLAVIAGAALFARRQNPRAVFAIAVVVLVVSVFVGRNLDFVPAVFALYALAVYRSARSAWIGYGIMAVATIVTLAIATIVAAVPAFAPLSTEAVPSGFAALAFCIVAVLIGSNVGNRRRYLNALIDRARQLARERDQQAELATAAERSRVAREMHDIVSHSLTVMIALADGSAGLVASDPERSAETMRLVAETGRGALGDMRRLLGVLRSGEEEAAAHAPQPGLGDLGELIERFRAAGLPVRITVSGTPPTDVGQQLTVFRVVQEALTNTLRHAALATVVAVTIEFGDRSIRIAVEDDATVHTGSVQGAGSGLLGLRERVALYGGTLEAGPRRGGGWRLAAEFATVQSPADQPTTADRPTTDRPTAADEPTRRTE